MPPLTAEQLAYVVTHGELLAMLSLQRLEAMLDAGAEAPAPSAEELAAAEAATMAELARQQQQWLAQAGGTAPAAEPDFLLQAAPLSTAGIDIGEQIDSALAVAYAEIPVRAQALQGVDTTSLAPALTALPEALPPLTGALDTAGMSAWLDAHDAGDPALERLMAAAGELAGSAG
ncbi:hypothetical protein ACG04R_18385 [Roseateles sp. BYS78W]|uniref:Uncharacterized protein n=1 Tax=Pelomonas candidula TaxID=3299025 RepID=A0ABW7HFH0_9BURK